MWRTAINPMRGVLALKNPLTLFLGGLLLLGVTLTPFDFVSAQGATAPTSQPTAVANGSGENSGDISLASMGIGAILSPVALISYAVFTLAKGILWISGIIFNYAVLFLVFEFAKHLGTTPGMLLGWSLLRDLGNIMLLFSFIWIGIRMILNVSHFSAGKTLAQLVLFATLLNFSLFISAAIVDGSNGLTLALFSQNVGYKCDESMEKCLNDGVAGQILQQVNILSVVGGSGQELNLESQVSSYLSKPLESILQFLLLSIIVSVAAAVLLAGGILIVTRGITLAFLLVTSPIGFAGMAFEPFHEMSERWWKALINNALFAPVFLVLLFLGLRLTDGLATLLGTEGGFAGALAGGGSLDAGPIFLFVLVIGFMLAALMVGKKFGIAGADFAVNTASALTYGTLARGTNLTSGIMALNARRYLQSKDPLGKNKGIQVLTNRFLRPLEKANLDLRRTGLGTALKAGGVGSGAEAAEHATLGDLRHMYDDAKEGKEGKKLEKEYKAEIAIKALEDNAHHGALTDKDQQLLASMGTKDLEKMHGVKEAVPALAQALSSQQFEDLMKTDGLDETEKGNLRSARFAEVTAATNPTEATNAMKPLNKSDLEAMPSSTLMKPEVLSALNDKQREDLLSSNKRTATEKTEIRKYTPAAIFERAYTAAPSPAAKTAFVQGPSGLAKLKPAQVAKLPVAILKDPTVGRNLTAAMLKEIEKENKLEDGDIRAIAAIIRGGGTAGAQAHINPLSPASGYWN